MSLYYVILYFHLLVITSKSIQDFLFYSFGANRYYSYDTTAPPISISGSGNIRRERYQGDSGVNKMYSQLSSMFNQKRKD